MLSLVLSRAILVLLPFAAWFGWREVARRRGVEMGSTPWGWLVFAGALLVVLSLFASALLRPDNRDAVYRPAQAHPGGAVTPGGFEPRR